MLLFHPVIDKLILLRQDATPGVWGPTTMPPEAKGEGEHSPTHHYSKDGKRGEPAWGAVVSDQDPRPGKDHERYYNGDNEWFYEKGTDIYGGTLVCESLFAGNGEYIAALNNNLPGLVQTIRNLRHELLMFGLNEVVVDRLISDSMVSEETHGI